MQPHARLRHLLWLAVVLGMGAADPSALVEQLGAPRYADREAAAKSLEALGRAALPALRAARRSADPEARASALLGRIETAELVRPTLVRLDFPDRPLGEIVEELERQSGIRLQVAAGGGGPLAGRRITLQAPGPVPFWEAIDRLGRAGSLRTELRPVPVGEEYPFGVVLEQPGERLAPTSCHGPFRVKLASLSLRRELDLDPPARSRLMVSGAGLTGRLLVSGEPRLILGPAGDVRLEEATDETGRSLLAAEDEPAEPRLALPDSIIEFTGGPELNLPMAFARPPAPEARRLHRVRGSVPVAVAATVPDPLVVPLSTGQSVAGDELVVTVEGIKPAEEGNRLFLGLRFRAQPWSPQALTELAAASAASLFEQQFQVLDRTGRPAQAAPAHVEADEGELRLHVLVAIPDGAGPPDRLVLHSLIRTVVEIPFDFADVPLP